MGTVAQLLLGALFCLLFVTFARRAGLRRELAIYAAALAAAAFIYVIFAAFGGATLGWVAVETSGLAIFSLLVLLARRGSREALIVGWAVHPAWDVLIHGASRALFVPGWYPVLCAGFDLTLAVYIALRVRAAKSDDVLMR
ncbi:MAG: hypothetical protein M3348_11065 [Acidobacteriota bacterium]|nr:hypothetical protein [Acidobacteriota bacterium]MDQ3919006.1 hypothetical protein [Acidobacteriota bacterium]